MDLPGYTVAITEKQNKFEFTSEGPKGKIRKRVLFTRIGYNLYNLSFGDIDKTTDRINDVSISDNKDRNRILSTVATIVYIFTNLFPNVNIVAVGSTPARNRLYRMGITINWKMISQYFTIYGSLNNNSFELFEVNKNYDSFLATRK